MRGYKIFSILSSRLPRGRILSVFGAYGDEMWYITDVEGTRHVTPFRVSILRYPENSDMKEVRTLVITILWFQFFFNTAPS